MSAGPRSNNLNFRFPKEDLLNKGLVNNFYFNPLEGHLQRPLSEFTAGLSATSLTHWPSCFLTGSNMFQQENFIFLCKVHGGLSATSSSHDLLIRPLVWLEPHLFQQPAWVMFWWEIWIYFSPPTNMLKNALKSIKTWSTSTCELHTPEYTIRTQHQWRRAMETDVNNHDLLLGWFSACQGYHLTLKICKGIEYSQRQTDLSVNMGNDRDF